MFDKDNFSKLLINARGDRNNKQYSEDSGVSRAYISGYINKNIENPPTPDIIRRFANSAQNKVSYEDFMKAAGHITGITREEKVKEIEQMNDFENEEEALRFILAQPSLMHYGGYDLDKMSEEEILEIANDMLFAMKLSIEKMKRKNK